MDQNPSTDTSDTAASAEQAGEEVEQPTRRRPRTAVVSIVALLVAGGVVAALLIANGETGKKKPSDVSTATSAPGYGDAPAQIAPETTAATAETLPVKAGADVTYGGLRFTNNAPSAIKIVSVKPVIVGGDDKRINVADVVVVYPVPEEAVELAKGWPPKEYGPNVFFAPGDLAIPTGDEVQILLRLARNDEKELEIDGFEVTYSIGEESFTETIGKKLTLGK